MKFYLLVENGNLLEQTGNLPLSSILIPLIFLIVIGIGLTTIFVYLVILAIKALRRYLRSSEVRTEKVLVRKTLGETLKEYRMQCNMTQEFVAEAIGVSRQAVSKWETGASDPSTANLLALAKLYEVSAQELLKNVSAQELS
ncbi:MAG: helix-turn-helix domain-containing protein [Lachnospiraceae bacterium]|nr:helix-turn-helix domain-containing protein [Lachnospiraceae bacterium]